MPLNQDQAWLYSDFAEAAAKVHTEQAFKDLINEKVHPLIPHRLMLAVIGQLSFDHLTVHRHVAVNYPSWALAQVVQPINIKERPLLQRWLHTREPVIACPVADRQLMSEREVMESEAIGLGRLAIHGLPDLTKRMGSYFSFAQVPPDIDAADLALWLTMITPLLHIALFNATQHEQLTRHTPIDLTSIEQELLVWLAAGRSNQEMAVLRQRSPATIRNQLVKLYAKLGFQAPRCDAHCAKETGCVNVARWEVAPPKTGQSMARDARQLGWSRVTSLALVNRRQSISRLRD